MLNHQMMLEKIRAKIKKFHHFERLAKYGSIGVFTTLGFFITWNVLIYLTKDLEISKNNYEQVVSISQYVASVSWIIPSFLLNRKLTFKDLIDNKKSLKRQMAQIFAIYNISPIIASAFTFLALKITPDAIRSLVLNFNFIDREIMPFLFLLQIVGILINFTLNYLLQYIFVYRLKKKN